VAEIPKSVAERRAHFRGSSRQDRAVEVRVRRHGAPERAWQPALTRDSGVGGASIATPLDVQVGSLVELELVIPGGDGAIVLSAQVRWVSGGAGPRREVGMGLSFGALEVDVLLALSDYFALLTAGAPAPARVPR
jgi:hypothetical protein